jgi:hypothetical protein
MTWLVDDVVESDDEGETEVIHINLIPPTLPPHMSSPTCAAPVLTSTAMELSTVPVLLNATNKPTTLTEAVSSNDVSAVTLDPNVSVVQPSMTQLSVTPENVNKKDSINTAFCSLFVIQASYDSDAKHRHITLKKLSLLLLSWGTLMVVITVAVLIPMIVVDLIRSYRFWATAESSAANAANLLTCVITALCIAAAPRFERVFKSALNVLYYAAISVGLVLYYIYITLLSPVIYFVIISICDALYALRHPFRCAESIAQSISQSAFNHLYLEDLMVHGYQETKNTRQLH